MNSNKIQIKHAYFNQIYMCLILSFNLNSFLIIINNSIIFNVHARNKTEHIAILSSV